MTTTYSIADANWAVVLAEVVNKAQEGDTIIVRTWAQRELAERALTRVKPGINVLVLVAAERGEDVQAG